MTGYTRRYPGAGDMGPLMDLSDQLRARKEISQSTREVLSATVTALGPLTWDGDAARAWRTRATDPAARLRRTVEVIDVVRAAIAAYVVRVAEIRARAAPYQQALEEADALVRRLVWDADYTGALQCYGDPATVERARQHLREQADDDATRAWLELERLESERRSADGALCDALAVGEPEGWDSTYRVLRTAGVDTVAELEPERLGAAFAAVAARDADQTGTPQSVADLQVFFDGWGTSEPVMSAFFATLGGTATVRLVDRLGQATARPREATAADLLRLAVAVRGGLSRASAGWSAQTASAFADAMLVDIRLAPLSGARTATVGFLFADPVGAPQGRELAVALATAFDTHDRDPALGRDEFWLDTHLLAGGEMLSALTSREDGARTQDAAGRILQTLGLYPDAALAWLTDPSPDVHGEGRTGEQRVGYWFGTRSWFGDGFEGVSTLWAGAQRAEGGLLDGGTDVTAMTRIATLSTQVFEKLSTNPAFLPENVTPCGSEALATAVVLQLPQLVEYPMNARLEYDMSEIGIPRAIWGTEPRPIVQAKQDWVADLLGVAAHHPEGSWVLTLGVSDAQQVLAALGSDPTSGLAPEAAIDRIVALRAPLEGAHVGGEQALARREDAAVQHAVGEVVAAVGALPVMQHPFGGYLFGQASAFTGQLVGKQWATHFNEQLLAELDDEAARDLLTRQTIETIIDDYTTAGVMTAPADLGTFVDEHLAEYHNGFDAWAREAERRQDALPEP